MNKKLSSGSVRFLRVAIVVGLGLGFVSVRPARAQTGYVVEDLGALAGDTHSVAWAVNARGDVVGWSTGPNGPQAFVYTDADGMVVLPGLPDKPRTVARDINDKGVIVGSANAGAVTQTTRRFPAEPTDTASAPTTTVGTHRTPTSRASWLGVPFPRRRPPA